MKKCKVSRPSPVQAYLARNDRELLARLAEQLGTSMSGVIRRGIRAVERELTDPAQHPALRLIGMAARESREPCEVDVAREHDRYLAEAEEASWRKSKGARRRRGP